MPDDAFVPPADRTGVPRYSAKAREKARIELRKLDTRFLGQLSVTRGSFIALGVLGLVFAAGAVAWGRFLPEGPARWLLPGLLLLSSSGFFAAALMMRRWAGNALIIAWACSGITLIGGPIAFPLMLLSWYVWALPLLQIVSLITVSRTAWRTQRRRDYLLGVLASEPAEAGAADASDAC